MRVIAFITDPPTIHEISTYKVNVGIGSTTPQAQAKQLHLQHEVAQGDPRGRRAAAGGPWTSSSAEPPGHPDVTARNNPHRERSCPLSSERYVSFQPYWSCS